MHRILDFRNTFNLLKCKIDLEVTFLKKCNGKRTYFFINDRTRCRVLPLVLEDTQNTDVQIYIQQRVNYQEMSD